MPHTYELLEGIGFRDRPPPDLRTMTVAGGGLPAAQVRRYHRLLAGRGGRFFVMYGQTEATARIAYLPPHLAEERLDNIGAAIPGGALWLRDLDGRRLDAPEAEGELVYAGPNVMMGYAETRADLPRPRPAEVAELATGDLARRDRDGLYRIVGRLRRMSKIAGMRIGHDAVEAALAARGVAASVSDDDRRLLVAFEGPREPADVADLAAEIAGLTPRHVQARRWAELPRLPSGKPDYAAVKAQPGRDDGDVATAFREVFREAFHPIRPRPEDSFASLGGDSLRHVELSLELQRRRGRVPPGWERMTLAELGSLTSGEPRRAALGSDIVIRALAILAVVTQHQTGWPVYGGAAAMVVLIGFGIGRFQRGALTAGAFAGFFRPLLRVLGAYYLVLAGYALAWGEMPWASAALLGNFGFADPARHEMLPYLYWFVEAYAQMLLVLALPFLSPGVRRSVARAPFRFGLGLLAAAVAARLVLPQLWPLGGRQIFTLPWVFYLCALGWCVATADTRRRRLIVLGAAAALMPLMAYLGGNWHGAWIKYAALFGASAWLLFLPQLRLPKPLQRPVLAVAQASFLIYLLHRFAPELLMPALGLAAPGWATDALAVLGGLALGLAAARAQRWAVRRAAAHAGRPPDAAKARPAPRDGTGLETQATG